MLDTYVKTGSTSTNINVNAITGTIVKNYEKSFFKKFGLQTPVAEMLFNEEMPHLIKKVWCDGYGTGLRGYYQEEKKPIVIIQMMMCGELFVLCELMWKEDFDNMFKEEV